MAVSALVEAGIFSAKDVEEMRSSVARIAIALMGCRLVAENLPDILDTRLGPLNVEGS